MKTKNFISKNKEKHSEDSNIKSFITSEEDILSIKSN